MGWHARSVAWYARSDAADADARADATDAGPDAGAGATDARHAAYAGHYAGWPEHAGHAGRPAVVAVRTSLFPQRSGLLGPCAPFPFRCTSHGLSRILSRGLVCWPGHAC